MKPMPVSAMQSAICCGCRLMLAPSASITSALPDDEDTLRPPCLATRAPAAAATNIEAVEMLKVCAPSPPVPTMSSRPLVSASGTLVENSRMTCAAAAISPMVSFLTRKPMVRAATIIGDISPDMIWRNRDSISSWKISRCSMQRSSASCGVIGMVCGPVMVSVSGSSAAVRGRARSGWTRGGTARPRCPASCGARP